MRQLDLTERLLRLRGVPMFRSMTTTELAPLAASLRSRKFQKGDLLLQEDQPPRSFYMLLTGSVTMNRHGRAVRTITAPGGVGFLSLLARTAGGTEAVADSAVDTFELRGEALEDLFEDQFQVVLATLKFVVDAVIKENIDRTPPPYAPPDEDFDLLIGERELGLVERIYLLRRTVAFRHTNVNSTARLARRLKEVRVEAGTTIWHPGDTSDGSLFLVKGKMHLAWSSSRGTPVRQDVGPGYIVGGGESLAGQPRWNTLVADEDVVYLLGSQEALIDMFEDDVEVALQFMSMMATFLLDAWDRKAEAAASSSEMTTAADAYQPEPLPGETAESDNPRPS